MAKLKPGDRITVRLKENCIINPYDPDYEEVRTFDIVACDAMGYYLFVSPYTCVKDTIIVGNSLLKKLELDKKYLNDTFVYISENLVYKIKSRSDGCICLKCNDFHYQAAPNQDKGGFICWTCKNSFNY